MDYEEQDIEVIRMLSKLRDAGSTYPADMMASRRQSYVKKIAALGLGTGAALVMKEGAKAAGGSSIPPIASTIVETALIVAIVAEAGFVAFVNREKALDIFRKITGQPTVQQVTASPNISLPQLDPNNVEETAFMLTTGLTLEPTVVIETPTVVPTPSPEILVVTDPGSDAAADTSGVPVNSTPVPNGDTGTNGNNGNHYGQTPIPERTKEHGNNGGGSNSNNNDNDNGGNNGHRNNNRRSR